MARLYTAGFEMDSLTTSVEWTTIGSSGQSLTSGAARTGNRGMRISSMTSATPAGVNYKFVVSADPGPFFLRAYLNVQTLPTASNDIIALNSTSAAVGGSPQTKITLEANGTLRLRNQAGTAIGSASAALSTGTWYMVELKTDTNAASGSRIMEARLNGTIFATSSTQTHASCLAFTLGGNLDSEAQTTGEWWFDDVAINDSTGSFQTGYPGSGKIIQLNPSVPTGDANGFATQVGGSGGSTSNYTRVNEVPTDNASSYNASVTLNAEDLFNVDDSNIGASDTVSLVAIGVRLRSAGTTDAVTALQVELEKTSGGTIAQGSSIPIGQNTFATNAPAVPRNPTLTAYQDPNNTNWTQSTLDSMQIGYKITTVKALTPQAIQVSSVWATVEYVPVVSTATNELALLGVG